MRRPIGIGVIGTGFGQYVHIPAFRMDSRCEVRAICSRQLEKAQELATKLGISRAYGDSAQLFADPTIDAIAIAVPPYRQPALIEAAARAGKHLFCEKPVGSDLADANIACDAARAAGVVSAVDFIFPEIGAWAEAKRIVQSGELGSIRSIAISWRVETRAYRSHEDSWKTAGDQGGGTLRNLGSHSAYYIEWLFGRVTKLAGKLRGITETCAVDAGVEAWMQLQNGTRLTLSISADAYQGSGHVIEVYGDTGTLILSNTTADFVNGFELLIAGRSDKSLVQSIAPIITEVDGRQTSCAKIVTRFLDAIWNKTVVMPSLDDGLRAQALLEAIRTSDSTGQWVDV